MIGATGAIASSKVNDLDYRQFGNILFYGKDGAKQTIVSGKLSKWEDFYNNGEYCEQSTAGSRPTVNGDSIEFDGVDDFLTFSTRLGKPANFTIIAKFKVNNASALSRVFGSFDGVSASTAWGNLDSFASSPGDLQTFHSNDSNYSYGKTDGGVLTNGQWAIIAIKYTAGQTTRKFYKNGLEISQTDISVLANSNSGGSYEYCIGRLGALNSDYFNGSLKSFLIFDTAVDDNDILTIYEDMTRLYIKAEGGTISYFQDQKIHTFSTDDDLEITHAPQGSTLWYLLVAGGGSGIGGANRGGGGGGGGVLEDNSHGISVGTYPIVIGQGGTQSSTGNNGTDTTFDGLTAVGGGHGGRSDQIGADGGSGGGGGNNTHAGGTGTPGQGYDGGDSTHLQSGGGGGGAGEAGADSVVNIGGDGGDGIQSSITGTSTYYGGGGGGCAQTQAGLGGQGGGGNGAKGSDDASNGTDGLGGGGGSVWDGSTGGDGGNGIAIFRYKHL